MYRYNPNDCCRCGCCRCGCCCNRWLWQRLTPWPGVSPWTSVPQQGVKGSVSAGLQQARELMGAA